MVDKVNEVGEADVVDEVNHLFLHVCDARLHQFHFVLKEGLFNLNCSLMVVMLL